VRLKLDRFKRSKLQGDVRAALRHGLFLLVRAD
jgi:hypothetical protein